MESTAPLVHVRPPVNLRLGFWPRMLAAGLAGGCLVALAGALLLKPSPTGVGTHEKLGFNRCHFLYRTGLPCPSCGMTTSFAWFVRGNVLASFYTQPMGTALATATVLGFWSALYVACTGA